MTPEFAEQYNVLRTGIGVAELPGRTIIAVTGADRTQFLQSFTTNDIKKLIAGRGCEAFVTSTQGKTVGHILIFCETDRYVLDTSPGQAAALISHFERYVISEDVQFVDITSQYSEILVAGPNAAKTLESVTGAKPPPELLGHAPSRIADSAVIVRRIEYAGPTTYIIQAVAGATQAVVAALRSAGAALVDRDVIESARLESGFPLFGIDITEDNLPQEVNRDERAISFTKGCYLGQETVARIDAVGHVNRLLVGLKFTGRQIPSSGLALLAGEQPVGHVTSAAWSPKLNAPLAMGYVRRIHAKPGSQLASSAGSAEVAKLPLEH